MLDALDAIMADLGACSDCSGALPTCYGNVVAFCDGDVVQTISCSDSSETCGTYNATLGDRCLAEVGEPCGADVATSMNVCDPQLSLNCIQVDANHWTCQG